MGDSQTWNRNERDPRPKKSSKRLAWVPRNGLRNQPGKGSCSPGLPRSYGDLHVLVCQRRHTFARRRLRDRGEVLRVKVVVRTKRSRKPALLLAVLHRRGGARCRKPTQWNECSSSTHPHTLLSPIPDSNRSHVDSTRPTHVARTQHARPRHAPERSETHTATRTHLRQGL